MKDKLQSSGPAVSVILPVLDDPQRLRLCLQALERQTLPRELFETIVVDNGPSDTVRGVVEEHAHCRYAVEPRRSSYAARNRGIDLARGTILAFTDADCLPAPDWIAEGVAALRADPAPGLVAGRVDVFPLRAGQPTAVELFEMLTAFPQREFVARWQFGATANVFTSRKVMEQAGTFNPQLQSGGDMEWGRRVHAAGWPVVYADDVRVAHPARRTFAELRSKEERVVGGAIDLAGGRGRWRRLPLNLFYDWPRPGDMARLCRDDRLRGTGDRLRILGIALFVKGVRSRVRIRRCFTTGGIR
jgi:glycosyltransferase involved in cell wall biosynthesis